MKQEIIKKFKEMSQLDTRPSQTFHNLQNQQIQNLSVHFLLMAQRDRIQIFTNLISARKVWKKSYFIGNLLNYRMDCLEFQKKKSMLTILEVTIMWVKISISRKLQEDLVSKLRKVRKEFILDSLIMSSGSMDKVLA